MSDRADQLQPISTAPKDRKILLVKAGASDGSPKFGIAPSPFRIWWAVSGRWSRGAWRDAIDVLDGPNYWMDLPSIDHLVWDRVRLLAGCAKCGGAMQDGKAMQSTATGIGDFGADDVCTVSAGGPGQLVDCRKCSQCGWSVT